MGYFLSLFRNSKKRLERSGVEAEAVILKMEKTGLVKNNLAQVKLQMRVQPDKGRNFIAEIEEMMSGNEQLLFRTGSVVKVKFNPNNYRQLLLVIECV